MKTNSSRWGWLAFSLGALALVLTWLFEAYALFCWAFVVVNLGAMWIALVSLRLGLTQWLIVGATMLNAAAGVCNGLVMTANGMQMPVEPIYDWSSAPVFLDSDSDRESRFCHMINGADEAVMPTPQSTTHFDVPTPHVVQGKRIVPPDEPPRFAALDDRHGIRICGANMAYSKGDMMGFIGTVMLGIPGFVLLLLGFLWRKIRRK
ncbi:MAG TPA: hypothetical protein VL283_02345 [Candidatus Baltobacteraceae bacterium]|nr:hypothetical protein [Candidatus Baltobacteraceae bacterium]